MIFVTVGTQLPFDRMVEQVDAWAGRTGGDVFAQIGHTRRKFSNIETVPFLGPKETADRFRSAKFIVAHAGMGSILSALSARKPLLVIPRRADLREHTNDHQMACSRRLAERGLITVAWDLKELSERLDHLVDVSVGPEISGQASDEILKAVRGFVAG